MDDNVNLVYIPEEDEYGVIITEGAFASLVRYSSGGVLYEVMLLNEEFEVVREKSYLEEEN